MKSGSIIYGICNYWLSFRFLMGRGGVVRERLRGKNKKSTILSYS